MNLWKNNGWIAYEKPKLGARLRLFCFPYAGGSASIFRDWAGILPSEVDVYPVQLPGRENRLGEPPFTQIDALIPVLARALRPYLQEPFAFWGHSMGALISFELARQLRRERRPGPIHLFVSGHKAPQVTHSRSPIHQLPETAFIEELRQLNGTPEAALENSELMQLLLPALRADFTLVETAVYVSEDPLDCAITVFGGLQDEQISRDDLEGWRDQTHHTFKLHMLPGDHFFLHSNRRQLLQVMFQALSRLLAKEVDTRK